MSNQEHLVKHRRTINLVLRTFGNTLIMLALLFLFLGFWPYLEAEFNYNWNLLIGQKFFLKGDHVSASSSPLGAILGSPPPISITPVNTEYSLIIPKIDVNSPVVANVDPGNYNQYMEALTHGVAQAKGTVNPGSQGNSYIFAHSALNFWDAARYNAVFTLLSKLEPGDLIVTYYKGQRYDYYVTQKMIIDPSSVQYLSPQADGRQLSLQTCDPPGINLKRLIVFAKMH